MMRPATDNPASCEIRAVIHFLRAKKNTSAAKINRELCAAVYGQTIMSEGTVRQWCKMFKDTMKSEVVGRPPVVFTRKCVKDGASQFQNFRVNFHKFHALFSMRLSQLG
jgi:hypothetical protein